MPDRTHYAHPARGGGPACNLPQAAGPLVSDLAGVTCKACTRSAPYRIAAGTLTRDALRLPASDAVHWHPAPGTRPACRTARDPDSIAAFEHAGRLTTDREAATCRICTRRPAAAVA